MRDELKKAKERFKETNEKLKKSNDTITNLKVQVVEGKRVEDYLNAKFKENFEDSKLEQEIVILRSNLEKSKTQEDKFKKGSTLFDDILASQKSSKEKEGLGFERG